jgi:hypothetical protein
MVTIDDVRLQVQNTKNLGLHEGVKIFPSIMA